MRTWRDGEWVPGLPSEPQTESPIEDIFLRHVERCLRPEVAARPQVSVETPMGRFRVDFVVVGPLGAFGVECDGAEYHGGLDDLYRDRCRDQLILSTGAVQAMYRFGGAEITHSGMECLAALIHWEGSYFTDAARRRVNRAAHFDLTSPECSIGPGRAMWRWPTATRPWAGEALAFRRTRDPTFQDFLQEGPVGEDLIALANRWRETGRW